MALKAGRPTGSAQAAAKKLLEAKTKVDKEAKPVDPYDNTAVRKWMKEEKDKEAYEYVELMRHGHREESKEEQTKKNRERRKAVEEGAERHRKRIESKTAEQTASGGTKLVKPEIKDTKRLNADIAADLYWELKTRAAQNRETISDIVRRAVIEYLSKGENTQGLRSRPL